VIRRSKKASARKKLISEADQLVRKLVLARDGYACVRCNKSSVLQAAHILPKGHYPRMRFELLNVLSLDVGCHLFFAHKDPTGFTAWLGEKYPGRIEQLRIMAATARKIDMPELLLCLRKEVSELDPPFVAVHGVIKDDQLPF